jgi:hypothetical protein
MKNLDPAQAKKEFETSVRRFTQLMSDPGGLTTTILKGHLLIEEQLRDIIEAAVQDHRYVEKARLSFIQRLNIARAIAGHFNNSVVWEATVQLNAIRNRLAHKAEASLAPDLLSEFFSICESDTKFDAATQVESPEAKLNLCLIQIWTIFDALHDVVRVCRLHSPLP